MQIRVTHLVLGLVAASALGFAVWAWRSASERQDQRRELDQGLADLREDVGERERKQPLFVRRQVERSEESARELVFTPPPGGDPLEPSAQEAVDAFTEVLDELEQALDEERKLSPVERDEYYERATGSFKAMSAWVDASNPNERALLEDSHAQMKDLMRRLGIKPPAREIDGFVSARER